MWRQEKNFHDNPSRRNCWEYDLDRTSTGHYDIQVPEWILTFWIPCKHAKCKKCMKFSNSSFPYIRGQSFAPLWTLQIPLAEQILIAAETNPDCRREYFLSLAALNQPLKFSSQLHLDNRRILQDSNPCCRDSRRAWHLNGQNDAGAAGPWTWIKKCVKWNGVGASTHLLRVEKSIAIFHPYLYTKYTMWLILGKIIGKVVFVFLTKIWTIFSSLHWNWQQS